MTPVEKLQALLRDLFQIDRAELDFGIYRLFRLQRDQIDSFLEDQLPRAVQDAFTAVDEARRAELSGELEAARSGLQDEFPDRTITGPGGALTHEILTASGRTIQDLVSRYREARAALDEVEASDDQIADVFNHLHAFFSRYYDEGDFVPRHHYGARERYAVPYNGEETYFHWANRGQHYVKSAEVLRDYAFTVPGDLVADERRVRFVLTGGSTPPGDTKGDVRCFFPLPDGIEWDEDDGTLTVPFHFRLPTEAEANRHGRKIQQELIAEALPDLYNAVLDDDLRAALQHREDLDDDASPTVLERHLRRFVRRSTSDYFVHPDLGGFLAQELEFYIKDQVLHVADLDGHLETRLRTIRVLRDVARDIVAFLASIEDVQKRLFEKRKFVLRTDYMVLLHVVPREMWGEVVSNERQLDRWEELFKVTRDEVLAADGKPDLEFLESRPTLVVDTELFDDSFRDRILATVDDLDDAIGGVLIHSENYQAQQLIQPKYAERIKCIYTDPPYNTGSDEFIYKDRYQHSSWLAMMEERLPGWRSLLANDGVLYISIDEKELARLKELLDENWGNRNRIGELVWKNATDNNPTQIAQEHEYILCYAKDKRSTPGVWKSKFSSAKELLLTKWKELAAEESSQRSIQRRYRRFLKDNEPLVGKLARYKHVDAEGPFTGSESVHNPHPGGYDYEIIHPGTGKPMNKPAYGYRFPEETMRRDYLEPGRLIYGKDERRIVKIKLYLRDYQDALRSVIALDGRLGAYDLRRLFGAAERVFRNPKPVELIERLVSFATADGGWVADFFAGSGTTGEAVLNLRRIIGGDFRPLLVEAGGHFDSVVVPRMAKVLYAADWRSGEPRSPGPAATDLVKVLRLESYEDALHNLVATETTAAAEPRAAAHASVAGEDDYRLRYLARLPLESSSTMLRVGQLAHPFSYTLETLTNEGPAVRAVDLVETFNLAYGLHVERIAWWRNEEDGQDDGGRRYRAVVGRDREDRRTLVLWRDMTELDAGVERVFLEARLAEADPPYDRVLINGDTATPAVDSLDPLFKRLIELEE